MKSLLTILIAFLLFTACKKKDDTIYLSQDIKTKFGFKPGSYWIYRDSISGRVDSCWLSEAKLYITGFERGDPWPYERLSLRFVQRPTDSGIKDETHWSLYFEPGDITGEYYKLVNRKEVFRQTTFACKYPIPFAFKNIDYQNYQGTTMGFADYAIGSNTFDTVYNINRYVSPALEPSQSFNNALYLNDSVGYIKMSINCQEITRTTTTSDTNRINEVWELQRWNVIK